MDLGCTLYLVLKHKCIGHSYFSHFLFEIHSFFVLFEKVETNPCKHSKLHPGLCALLVAGATASCLSDAIPPGDRQNLVPRPWKKDERRISGFCRESIRFSYFWGFNMFQQTEVNMNGESYPIGFFISNYAASYAANILASKLVAEVLGFNTTLNLNSLGSGTVAGYYGVTGCRTPNNVADRGCLQGATRHGFFRATATACSFTYLWFANYGYFDLFSIFFFPNSVS